MAAYDEVIAERLFAEHEHRELRRGIDQIRGVADQVGSVSGRDLAAALVGLRSWIHTVLDPHIAWEDGWLYPQFDHAAGSTWATRLMRFEHRQIHDLIARLEARRDPEGPHRDDVHGVRAELYGLEALLRAHIEREERFLVPLLGVPPPEPVEVEGGMAHPNGPFGAGSSGVARRS